MVVTYPGKKPCSVRVDQLDRNIDLQKAGDYKFPEIVHFGIRPPQLSYAGSPEYVKLLLLLQPIQKLKKISLTYL